MEIGKETTVGTLAAEHPAATRVFHKFGIDFCCGGGKSLEAAGAARGVDADTLIAELHEALKTADPDETNWSAAGLPELIDHILKAFHRPLDGELPRLDEMASKVAKVHADKDARLVELRDVFAALRAELESHMMKEEQILFPMILQGQGGSAGGPISVMEHEHDSAGAALARMRELTDGYEPPEEACNTWRALFAGLRDLEGEMHQHIHLENNILFPRSLSNG